LLADALFLLLAFVIIAGCGGPLRFPSVPLAEKETGSGLVQAYDTNGDKRADYFTTQGPDGRIDRIAYDTNGDGAADSLVRLDDIPFADCRHVVIVLDGVPYDLVEAFRAKGRLRLFYPPARVISTYPAMTDLALAEVFVSPKPLGFESLYYDHRANRLVGGNSDYLSLKNEAWARVLDYRAGTLLDPIAYIYPNYAFDRELDDFTNLLARRDRRHVIGYFVSTAGLATRDGARGIEKALDAVDRLSHQLVAESRGLVKVTVLADHGHTLKRCERIDFRKFLSDKGWRITDRLNGPRDVAPVEFGLITYASFAAHDRPGLAADLLQHDSVRLTLYQEGGAIVVRTRDGEARIEHRDDRYRYRASTGDPLQLAPILERLKADGKVDADGFIADRDLFLATADHRYPDPLDRLWRAFTSMVENVPDVIADLSDGYYAGAATRAAWFDSAASTHGDLGRMSSTTFIMSTVGPLAGPLRSRDIPQALERLIGEPWPPVRQGTGQ
jgi:predicted small lipoprotein YifL